MFTDFQPDRDWSLVGMTEMVVEIWTGRPREKLMLDMFVAVYRKCKITTVRGKATRGSESLANLLATIEEEMAYLDFEMDAYTKLMAPRGKERKLEWQKLVADNRKNSKDNADPKSSRKNEEEMPVTATHELDAYKTLVQAESVNPRQEANFVLTSQSGKLQCEFKEKTSRDALTDSPANIFWS